jgi:hypothetical protein
VQRLDEVPATDDAGEEPAELTEGAAEEPAEALVEAPTQKTN